MKKLLSMLLFVAAAFSYASCDEIDDAENNQTGIEGEISYSGSLAVTNGGETSYSATDVVFSLESENNAISIMMYSVCFDSAMPYPMDIEISDISATGGAFLVDSIVPTIGGVEYEDRTLTDVMGTFSESTLVVTFNYDTYSVSYAGTAQ